MRNSTQMADDHGTPEGDTAFPGVWQSLAWVVLFLILQLIVGVATIAIAVGLDKSGRELVELTNDLSFVAGPTIASLVASSIALLALLFIYLNRHSRAARIGLNRWSAISPVATLGWAAGLIGLGLTLNYGYTEFVIPDIEMQQQLRKLFAALPDTIPNQIMLVTAIVLIAPLLEELLFRGLLQNALARHLPVWAAILGAAAIFGAVHMDLHAFPALMAMGAVFGLLYHKTGSLRVTIIAHMANNGAALLLS